MRVIQMLDWYGSLWWRLIVTTSLKTLAKEDEYCQRSREKIKICQTNYWRLKMGKDWAMERKNMASNIDMHLEAVEQVNGAESNNG